MGVVDLYMCVGRLNACEKSGGMCQEDPPPLKKNIYNIYAWIDINISPCFFVLFVMVRHGLLDTVVSCGCYVNQDF